MQGRILRALAVFSMIFLVSGCAVRPVVAPNTWIDRDTGHRVWVLSAEVGSQTPYFTQNAFSTDGKTMFYIEPAAIRILSLQEKKTRVLISRRGIDRETKAIEMGRKTNVLYFLRKVAGHPYNEVMSKNIYSGEERSHAKVPVGYRIDSINSDETLAIGTREVDDLGGGKLEQKGKQLFTRGQLWYARYKLKIPMSIFVVDLRTGESKDILQGTNWLSHAQFSPIDPMSAIYCHEGPWHEVDRIWHIRIDKSLSSSIHRRSMQMEIAGHETWMSDGNSVMYDWQYPKGEIFNLAVQDLKTNRKKSFRLTRDQWSIHYANSHNGEFFAGDGASARQVARSSNATWIYLYRPMVNRNTWSENSLWSSGDVSVKRLVNMASHDYRLEPNVRLIPDDKMIIFRANIFGYPSVFGVMVDQSSEDEVDIMSTPELAARFGVKRVSLIIDDE